MRLVWPIRLRCTMDLFAAQNGLEVCLFVSLLFFQPEVSDGYDNYTVKWHSSPATHGMACDSCATLLAQELSMFPAYRAYRPPGKKPSWKKVTTRAD